MAKRAVKDFPAEFFQVWELALEGKLALELPSHGKAMNMRQQLNIFRKRLSEEASEVAAPLFEVDLVVEGRVISSTVLEWKRQIRAAAAVDPHSMPEVGTALAQAVDASIESTVEQGGPPGSTQDAVSETLENLGFTVKHSDT